MIRSHGMPAVCTAALVVVTGAQARAIRLRLPIADALATPEAGTRLDGSVKLFFGGPAHSKPAKSFGPVTTSQKTNLFKKSDKEGCEWSFLSALLSLQERARRQGGDAVINIKSIYDGEDFSSATEYERGAGGPDGHRLLPGRDRQAMSTAFLMPFAHLQF